MEKSRYALRTYTGEVVRPKGVGSVKVEYEGQKCDLPVTVVDLDTPTLMGRDWLKSLRLNWEELFGDSKAVNKTEVEDQRVVDLMEEFEEVFTEKLGCLKDFEVHIPVDGNVTPKFHRARPVPYGIRDRVEEELDRLERQGVWERVKYSKWAAPIVPVLKDGKDPSGPIRICGDYKVTVNKAAPVDTYPIPNTIDQLATLAGGEKFTKLDLSQAYQQLELDEESRELLTINTHMGLYRPKRLQFGVHSATGIFQREMDNRLRRIPFVKVRVDDILVSGRNDKEHLQNLRAVLQILKESGLTVKFAKCSFLAPEVIYCGYVVSKEGLKPMKGNVEAVKEVEAPSNVSQLRSFLGMVNYYNMYLPKLATVTEPLHQLLRKNVSWVWSDECQVSFDKVKEMLCSAPLLSHFDPVKPILVQVDASPFGLGAILSHVEEDGRESPVYYASRTLSAAERNYPQIEKEGLALVYAVKKFHQFLYGNKFYLFTDHKPLLGLFSETASLPARSASRVLRWAVMLSGYNYELKYRPGLQNGNADMLSRLPMMSKNGDFSERVVSVGMMELVKAPVTEKEVRLETRGDAELAVVLGRVLNGGCLKEEERLVLKPYLTRMSELTTERGCVLWGNRVIIPRNLRKQVLEELHEVHPGMVRMKALARSYVWWPGLDKEIEELVECCGTCQRHQGNPNAAPIHPWEKPSGPWQRVHIDHAGPVDGKTYLIAVDSYSKWIEVEVVKSTDATNSAKVLRK